MTPVQTNMGTRCLHKHFNPGIRTRPASLHSNPVTRVGNDQVLIVIYWGVIFLFAWSWAVSAVWHGWKGPRFLLSFLLFKCKRVTRAARSLPSVTYGKFIQSLSLWKKTAVGRALNDLFLPRKESPFLFLPLVFFLLFFFLVIVILAGLCESKEKASMLF